MKINNSLKLKQNICWFLICAFIVTMLAIKPFKVKSENSKIDNTIATTTPTTYAIRILELEPTDNFNNFKVPKVTDDGLITTGIQYTSALGRNVIIDRISMPEFIGKVDELNGKYDIIIIGRYMEKTNLLTDIKKKYSDYNIKTYESDITDRKANEIKGFIESGQLVYIDESIVDNKAPLTLKDTKLYNNFKGYKNTNKDNCVVQSFEDLSLEAIVSKYDSLDLKNKRLTFTINSETDYDKVGDEKGNPSYRARTLSLSIPSDVSEKVSLNLYLDVNGDGLFKEKEIAYSITDVSIPVDNLIIKYQIPNEFVGELSWKLEIKRPDIKVGNEIYNVKSYKIGKGYFRDLDGESREIKVLQIAPFSESNLTTIGSAGLKLRTDTEFQKIINSSPEFKDYKLNITVMSTHEFNLRAGYEDQAALEAARANTEKQLYGTIDKNVFNYYVSKGPLKLNGNYNMVILGFADRYAGDIGVDGQPVLLDNAINELLEFANSKQSIMFTHDTMHRRDRAPRDNIYDKFSSLMGLKRVEKTGPYDNYRKANANWPNGPRIFSRSVLARKTNSAIITDYPFNLSEVPSNNLPKDLSDEVPEDLRKELSKDLPSNLTVRYTHTQYYQLDLEDEDVVPWYIHVQYENDSNELDVRNNYYTFSHGSLTFSGTGHITSAAAPYETDELKLFANTIVKALRGANFAPTIEEYDIYNYMEVPKPIAQNVKGSFKFSALFNDLEKDLMTVTIKVDGTPIRTENNVQSGTTINDINVEYGDTSFIVEIIAKDQNGAISTKKFNVIPKETEIKHGIYDGINNGNVSLYDLAAYTRDEDNAAKVAQENGENESKARLAAGRVFSKTANVPFVAKFSVNRDTTVYLQPDTIENIDGNPIIYEIKEEPVGSYQFEKVGEMTKNNNVYEYNLKYKFNDKTKSIEYIVMYNYKFVKYDDNEIINVFSNTIKFKHSSEFKDQEQTAKVKMKKDSPILPLLF